MNDFYKQDEILCKTSKDDYLKLLNKNKTIIKLKFKNLNSIYPYKHQINLSTKGVVQAPKNIGDE